MGWALRQAMAPFSGLGMTRKVRLTFPIHTLMPRMVRRLAWQRGFRPGALRAIPRDNGSG
jgi:hypothetical protein